MPPPNDDFADALTLVGYAGSAGPVTIDDATIETGEPAGSALTNGLHQTVWFKWSPPGSVPFEVEFDTHGSPTTDPGSAGPDGFLDTTLAVWTGASLAGLTEVASDDDDGDDPSTYTSKVTFTARPGESYYIQVGVYDSGYLGDVDLNWSLTGPLSRPAAVLAEGTEDGTTIVLTLDRPVPADGTLHVVFSTVTEGAATSDTVFASAASDPTGDTWDVGSFIGGNNPIIGLAEWDLFHVPASSTPDADKVTLYVGSVGRACIAGDLAADDAVTVDFHSTYAGNFHVTALLVFIPAAFHPVYQDGPPTVYDNGLAYPDTGTSTSLHWLTDDLIQLAPDKPALMIAGLAAYPGVLGFASAGGSVLGELLGHSSLAVTLEYVYPGANVEPGGTWPSAQRLLVGNYQTAIPLAVASGERFNVALF
jgi:hypothetical protein